MGSWYYTGELNGHSYEVRAYIHLTPRYDGDDEGFVILWHTTKDGQPWGCPTTYPVEQVATYNGAEVASLLYLEHKTLPVEELTALICKEAAAEVR